MTAPDRGKDTVKPGGIGKAPPRKRFYKQATVAPHDAGFAVALDGRVAKTPAGKPLAVRSEALAVAVADEWSAQDDRLDPAAMPLTRLVNTAFDGVADKMADVRADIVRYAASDLICYRAEDPEGLVALQEALWSPLIGHVQDRLGVDFAVAKGIMYVEQNSDTLAAFDTALEGYDALGLAAIHIVTTLTGSAVIALALADNAVTAEAAWVAAHVDEDWQMSQWGKDEQALERRSRRWGEMAAAGLVLSRA